MDKVLVTGGAGFIGSHVCEALLSKGNYIICVDNFNNYYNPMQKEENIKGCINNKNFRLYKQDIVNYDEMEIIFQKEAPKKVIHLAARAGVRASFKDSELYFKVNVTGTKNLLELASKYKVKNFIFGSSSSVYGVNEKIPFSESDRTDAPISPYALTKKTGELLCFLYSRSSDLNIACLRFFTVYGPRNRPDMAVYKFTDSICHDKPITMFGDGSSKRDYTYVMDIVDGIIGAMNHEHNYEIFNLGNSSPIELRELVSIIENTLKKKAKIIKQGIPKGDVLLTYADISKAEKKLGYKPKTSINLGIKKFIEWYLNHQPNKKL